MSTSRGMRESAPYLSNPCLSNILLSVASAVSVTELGGKDDAC